MDARAVRERREPRTLTSLQFALWKGQRLYPDVPLYNMAHTFRIHAAVDAEAFDRAFRKLVAGTDVLRSVVVEPAGDLPLLDVLDDPPVHHRYTDVAGSGDPGARLDAIVDAQARRTFAAGEPLYESELVRTDEAEYVWCLTLHHLIVDFLSVTLLFERMSGLLEDDSRASRWPTFTDYMDWLDERAQSAQRERAAAYWQRQASGDDVPPLEMFGNRLSGTNPRADRLTLVLGRERSARIEALCQEAPFRTFSRHLGLLNVFSTLLWAFLYRTTNRDRVTVGTPLHNRSSAAFRETAGLLINILPIAAGVEPEESYRTLAERIGPATLEATKYAAFPPPASEMHRGVDAIVNFLTGDVGEFAGRPCDFTWLHTGYADPHHAIRLQVQDFAASGEFTLYLDINDDLLTGLERHRITDAFLAVVDACLEDPGARLDTVDLLPGPEYERLVRDFNQTRASLTPAATLNELIAPGFLASADDTAIRYRGGDLTYADLDARVGAIAAALADAGVGRGDGVAIRMRRSPDLVATLLAAMRIGAYWIPVDPAQPTRRVEAVLQDARPAILVADRDLALDCDCPLLDPEDVSARAGSADDGVDVDATDVAYTIYTSGSTGEPKGVVVEHRSIVNYVAWAADHYVREAGIDRPAMPFYTSPAVDLTLTSLFVPLVTGGSIVIYEADDLRNDLSIVDVFKDDAVDILKLTPAHLALLRGIDGSADRIGTLILGGENLTTAAVEAVLPRFPHGVRICNEYGPTETVVGCMIHEYDPGHDAGPSVPIGRPIANMRVYALDRHGKPVPPGVVGELFVAGAGVARGYRNRPDLARDSFVELPAFGETRAYRTGDLVRFASDGSLTFHGRRDEQLKIRGNRVEPGDIEACLERLPRIASAGVALERSAGRPSEPAAKAGTAVLCSRCGLSSNYPHARIDPESEVCELCRQYDRYRERIDGYFRRREELRDIVRRVVDGHAGTPNAIALTSGGKDSTYALHQLVRMGLTPLVFTLDNGFISEQALDNVRNAADELGLELVIGRTPHMNDIFVDSLERHCNVCNGCFKTIYTMGINLARERGIDYLFTGLSRGQLFETRLAPEMFAGDDYSVDAIEQNIREARVAYHRRHDAVNERLDVSAFSDDTLFDRISIVDFYRYWDVGLDELYGFLATETGWVRPEDTGRSTNCRINEAGISVHKSRRGYHNYALPYSWDVRLGHKSRAEALAELDDEIDAARVRAMLDEIGYRASDDADEVRLVAAYTADGELDPADVRRHLEQELPAWMIPNRLFQLESLPLTGSGKLDRLQLAKLSMHGGGRADHTEARNALERTVSNIWTDVLDIDRLGIHENFFDIGGTSLPALTIVARCEHAFDIRLPLADFFAEPTVAGLAAAIERVMLEEVEAMSDDEAERALARLATEET